MPKDKFNQEIQEGHTIKTIVRFFGEDVSLECKVIKIKDNLVANFYSPPDYVPIDIDVKWEECEIIKENIK